jgi:hypothetical protein
VDEVDPQRLRAAAPRRNARAPAGRRRTDRHSTAGRRPRPGGRAGTSARYSRSPHCARAAASPRA